MSTKAVAAPPKKESNDRIYLSAYWQYLKHYKITLGLAFIVIPIISLLHVLQPILIKRGIDENILNKDIPGLYHTVILFLVCVCAEFILRAIQTYLFQYIGQHTVKEIREDLFQHIMGLSSGYFDKTPAGTVTSRLTSDMESLNESLASGMVTLIGDILTMTAILIAMLFLSPKLTLITILLIPPMMLMINFFRRKLREAYTDIRQTIGELSASLQEQLQGVDIIQLFQREEKNYAAFHATNKNYRAHTTKAVFYDALLYSLIDAISAITIALLIWYGFGQSLKGGITIGLLVAFIEYIQRLFQPLRELSTKFALLQQALAALEKIFGTFQIQDRVSKGNTSLEKFDGNISFNAVNFAYPGHEDKPVLKDISFDIKPGQKVAVVGPTGSGKTSISRLITRLYEGFDGTITLDNIPLSDIRLASLQHHIAIVTQDVQIFSESVAFNISLGRDTIDKSNIEKAAKLAGCHDIILGLENGYDTLLKNRGQSLSTGQRQLITFARALASSAPFVILDEATASIDSLTEKKIQDATEKLFDQKTALVIAHRLSTIQKADKILAMRNGQIVEAGTHDELISNQGFYANLFNMQFKHL